MDTKRGNFLHSLKEDKLPAPARARARARLPLWPDSGVAKRSEARDEREREKMGELTKTMDGWMERSLKGDSVAVGLESHRETAL